MTKEKLNTPTDLSDEIACYDSAVQLSISNAQGVWEIHNSMLFVNSILIGTIMLIIDRSIYGPILAMVLSLTGLSILFVWLCLVTRARKYADYYILSAREIEERSFKEPNHLLMRGAILSAGDRISFNLGKSIKYMEMGKIGKLGRVITSSSILVFSFGAIYVSILIVAINLLFTPN